MLRLTVHDNYVFLGNLTGRILNHLIVRTTIIKYNPEMSYVALRSANHRHHSLPYI